MCGWRLYHYAYSIDKTFRQEISRNSEANTSELLENLYEIFPRHWKKGMDHEQMAIWTLPQSPVSKGWSWWRFIGSDMIRLYSESIHTSTSMV